MSTVGPASVNGGSATTDAMRRKSGRKVAEPATVRASWVAGAARRGRERQRQCARGVRDDLEAHAVGTARDHLPRLQRDRRDRRPVPHIPQDGRTRNCRRKLICRRLRAEVLHEDLKVGRDVRLDDRGVAVEFEREPVPRDGEELRFEHFQVVADLREHIPNLGLRDGGDECRVSGHRRWNERREEVIRRNQPCDRIERGQHLCLEHGVVRRLEQVRQADA